jgi:hypothetical protein
LPQFGDRHLEAALLLLERIDLGDALFAGEVERRVVGAAEQVPDLGEREAESPAGEDQRQAFAVAAAVKPCCAAAR